MAKRSKKPPLPPSWKELARKELGLSASGPVAGPGWSNEGYCQIVYEVSEIRESLATRGSGSPDNYRTRVENGPACRFYGEGYTAFCQLYRTYLAHARAHTKDHKDSIGGYCFNKSFVWTGT